MPSLVMVSRRFEHTSAPRVGCMAGHIETTTHCVSERFALFKTSCNLGGLFFPCLREPHGFGFATAGPIHVDEPFRLQIPQTDADIALVAPQRSHQVVVDN